MTHTWRCSLRFRSFGLTAFLLLSALVPSGCAHTSPTLVNGTWFGSGGPPGGGSVELEYEVVGARDSLAITILAEFGEFEAHEIRLESDELRFWHQVDERYDCVLKLQEGGSYSGDCVGESGAVVSLRMRPPHAGEQWMDVRYAADTLTGHRMDIYLPERGEAPFPAVVVIAGSAFAGNDTKEGAYRIIGVPLLEAGYAVVAINHRSSLNVIFPAQIHDVKATVRFIRANASRFRLDADRIGIAGASSGGHLAAMMGTTRNVDTHTIGSVSLSLEGSVGELLEESSSVDAVVDWYGPTTFQAMDACGSEMVHDAPDSPASILIGGPIQENDELSALADPITYVDADDPPFLILHGDADPLVPHCQSELLYEALQAAGVESRLLIVPGGGHGRGMWIDTYIDQMVAFFDAHLKE